MSTSSFKNVTLAILVLGSSAGGCGDRGYPEGVYPCATAPECPPAWFCHSDHLCWSAPESDGGVDAGPRDAFVVDADGIDGQSIDAGPIDGGAVDGGPTDGGPPDTGVCVPTTESCNGIDDDCDGALDEGVLELAEPVELVAGDGTSPTLISTGDGIGMLFATSDQYRWQRLRDGTTAEGAAIPLGLDGVPQPSGFGAAFDGANVLVATVRVGPVAFFGFNPLTGGRTVGTTPFTIPEAGSRSANSPATIVGAAPGRATVLAGDRNGSLRLVRRSRLNTSGVAPALIAAGDAVSDLNTVVLGSVWGTGASDDNEFVLYRSTSNLVTLAVGAAGDVSGAFTIAGTIPDAGTDVVVIALSVGSPSAPISAENPLLVLTQTVTDTRLFTIDSLIPLHVSAAMPMPGSTGAPVGCVERGRGLDIVAMSGEGHWIVSGLEEDEDPAADTCASRVHVWEVFENGSEVRGLVLTSDAIRRGDISSTMFGPAALIAYETPTGLAIVRTACR